MGNHDRFIKHLDRSHEAVWFVARWLVERGNAIKIFPTSVAKEHKEWSEHIDGGDLTVWFKGEGDPKRFEIKRIGQCFTGKSDWPFPDYIVCAKHTYDNADPKPDWVIALSQDLKYAGAVSKESKDQWYTKKIKDHRYINYEQDFYVCSIDVPKWKKLR